MIAQFLGNLPCRQILCGLASRFCYRFERAVKEAMLLQARGWARDTADSI